MFLKHYCQPIYVPSNPKTTNKESIIGLRICSRSYINMRMRSKVGALGTSTNPRWSIIVINYADPTK